MARDKRKVLIVDDMPANRRLLTAYLVTDYECVVAGDGEEALAQVQAERPDLLLLDVMMPRLSGFEVCQRVKADPRTQHVPVILVTSLTSIDDKIKGQEAGADDFISKPIKRVELVLRVKSLLRIKSLHDQLTEKVAELETTKARLAQLANTDSLTSLANKRHFEKFVLHELGRAERYRRPLCVIMSDLDFFKRFNDTHGHPAGDMVLQQVAALYSEAIRNVDLAARYGGEEFVLVLPETSLEDGRQVAEKLRRQIAAHEVIDERGQPIDRITISMGVAAYPVDGADLQELIRAADRRLYRAKQLGRDRVVCEDAAQGPSRRPEPCPERVPSEG